MLAHLIETKYAGDLVDAVRLALNEVRGAYAIGVMHTDHPNRIVGARMNVPLIVGLGEGEGFLASDVPAILEHTKNVIILHEGDIAEVTPMGTRISSLDGTELRREVTEIHWDIDAAEKGGFAHFTLKEIYEQPHAIQECLRGRVDGAGNVSLSELAAIEDKLREVERVYVVGCGTASYAAHVAAYLIQDWVGLPATMQVGSEMRYSPPPIDAKTLVIGVSQSGETADTLAPLKMAEERGATVVVVTNVVGSAITREADAVCYLQAGPEIAVASTKAFVDPGAGAADDRPAPRRAARHADRRASCGPSGRRSGACLAWPPRRSSSPRRSRSSPSATRACATSSSSAAASASRSRWRVR